MALKKNDLVTLMTTVANAETGAKTAYSFGEDKFSYTELCDTLRDELNEIAGDYKLYRENKNMLFTVLEETFDDIIPKRVEQQYGQFAEIKQFAQGDKPIFYQRISTASKRRALQFITKVGLNAHYEVFKLDGRQYEVQTSAFGGAAQIGFEEFLDGRVDFADVLNIMLEGLDRVIYLEIERALRATITQLGKWNQVTYAGFNETLMDRLIQIADTYGRSTIYCTFEFASTMIPADSSQWSDAMKEAYWNNGAFASYKGHQVVIFDQSFEDETNAVKVIDPSMAWIIPNTAEKPVKIALEGSTIVREYENRGDGSREVQCYKKLGVGTIVSNNICVYHNTDLKRAWA